MKYSSNSALCDLHSTVIASLRSESPMAIGRNLPFGLRSATSLAEHSSSRAASLATWPLSRISTVRLSVAE